MSVLLQDNLGVLVDTYEQPVGAQPRDVHIADLNGDNMPDLVTANEGADTVSLLLSDNAQPPGGQLFAHRIDVATGGQPRSVAVADLNGDGVLDLATANGAGSVPSPRCRQRHVSGQGRHSERRQSHRPRSGLSRRDRTCGLAVRARQQARPGGGGGGANPLDVLVNSPDTPAGRNVVVAPVDQSTGDSPVTITFAQVTAGGFTTLRTSASGPPPPVGFLDQRLVLLPRNHGGVHHRRGVLPIHRDAAYGSSTGWAACR